MVLGEKNYEIHKTIAQKFEKFKKQLWKKKKKNC